MSYFVITRKNGESYKVLVDNEDFKRVLLAGPWHIIPAPNSNYVARYLARSGNRTQKLHRFILDAAKGWSVDHINRDGLDNRRANLRLCTKSQNQGNSCMRSNNRSGFKGVAYSRRLGLWQASIMRQGVHCHLGYHPTPEAAHEAYALAAAEVFGEFARAR